MAQKVQGAGSQPPARAVGPSSYVRIDWARIGRPTHFVSLSNLVFGAYLHWHDGGSVLCLDPVGACELCDRRHDRRWYGWLVGIDMVDGHTICAQIPHESYVRSKPLQAGGLAGAVVQLTRAENDRRRVHARVNLSRTPPPAEYKEPDVWAVLVARYGRIQEARASKKGAK